jgi:hypothetical protein
MKAYESFKAKVHGVGEHVEAFLERHEKKTNALMVVGGIGALGMAFATGNVSAMTADNSYYGLTVVDWALLFFGGIGIIGGLILRDFRVLLIGALMAGLGAVAFYLGV